jgi:hypothetical protein
VRFIACPCGEKYDTYAGGPACPKCGRDPATAARSTKSPGDSVDTPEKVRFLCACGAKLSAAASFVGRPIACPGCGRETAVPERSTREEVTQVRRETGTRPAPPRPAPKPDGWRRWARWSLAAGLLPLALFAFTHRNDVEERFRRTLEKHPQAKRQAEEIVRRQGAGAVAFRQIIQLLPGRRIEGALLPQTTGAHWIAAAFTAVLFWLFILVVQPMGTATSGQLWFAGVFTGTVGILLLLGIQVVSFGLTSTGCILMLPFAFITFSYLAALLPDVGFWLSFAGFLAGVGFLEELLKAALLYWHFRHVRTLDVRGAVVWGLAAGIGFGVSEGVAYSADFYNGLHGGGVYVVRFITVVALHAVWTGLAALLIWRFQDRVRHLGGWYRVFPLWACTIGPSILLHALYDTAAKKNLAIPTLAAALASFALFFWLYDRSVRDEPRLAAAA